MLPFGHVAMVKQNESNEPALLSASDGMFLRKVNGSRASADPVPVAEPNQDVQAAFAIEGFRFVN